MPFIQAQSGRAREFAEREVTRVVHWVVDAMVYLGSALMLVNICGFVRFARYIRGMKSWNHGNLILHIPIALLVCFLLGYLMVGLFGEPDIVVAGILFGGSVFVFVMYLLLSRIVQRVVESEHLEAELLAAEESSRVKSSFLASVSHEMRTPMNVILGLSTVALKNPELPRTTREQLEKIDHSAQRLSGLINGILDMQRFESGELTIRSEVFSMKDVLDQVSGAAAAACEAKGLAYETSFTECSAREYTGDAEHLKQALTCLLDNAVKFTDAPGTVRFAVNCSKAQGVCSQTRFVVSDTGIGIDPAFLPRAMEPFTQEDSSFTNRFGGSGMGLAMANGIVTRMGGRIEVESRKGAGSTFTVVLPLTPTGRGGAACAKPCEWCGGGCSGCSAAETAQPVPLAGRRVLVVDDVPENTEIVSDLLELEDVTCDCAGNGLEAIRKLTESATGYYDAILMDLRMPQMDGMEATRRIRALERADTRTIPIIALTANDSESDLQRSREAGMNAHLVKPVEADKLYAALGRWIGGMGKREVIADD